MKTIRFTVLGQLPRKSNRRRIVKNRRTGKMMVIRNEDAIKYERDFAAQVPADCRVGLAGDLKITAVIWYRSNRPDLSEESLMDCLERAGVISNDRQIVAKEIWKGIDKKNPRVELILEQIEWNRKEPRLSYLLAEVG